MADSNVARLRNAVTRVEHLLSQFEERTPVELWAAPPPEPAGRSSIEAPADECSLEHRDEGAAWERRRQTEKVKGRVEAAADVERILMEAQRVAALLHAEERRSARAMLTEAQQVAQALHAEKAHAAEAMLTEAQQVAEALHAEEGQAAEAMISEAQQVAEALHAEQDNAAEAMLTEAQRVAARLLGDTSVG